MMYLSKVRVRKGDFINPLRAFVIILVTSVSRGFLIFYLGQRIAQARGVAIMSLITAQRSCKPSENMLLLLLLSDSKALAVSGAEP